MRLDAYESHGRALGASVSLWEHLKASGACWNLEDSPGVPASFWGLPVASGIRWEPLGAFQSRPEASESLWWHVGAAGGLLESLRASECISEPPSFPTTAEPSYMRIDGSLFQTARSTLYTNRRARVETG